MTRQQQSSRSEDGLQRYVTSGKLAAALDEGAALRSVQRGAQPTARAADYYQGNPPPRFDIFRWLFGVWFCAQKSHLYLPAAQLAEGLGA